MDNRALLDIISRISVLKHKYLGSYPANLVPIKHLMSLRGYNTFIIVNTESSDKDGSHWILLANRDGIIFYGDSMGQRLSLYREIAVDANFKSHELVTQQLQQTLSSNCGLYCIYFAWKLFTSTSATIELERKNAESGGGGGGGVFEDRQERVIISQNFNYLDLMNFISNFI